MFHLTIKKEFVWMYDFLLNIKLYSLKTTFHGTLRNGNIFWSSLDTEPLKIELSKLIIGCQKIISMMKKGDKWKVFIDPTMAYGEEGRPGIPSNSILVFEIELLAID